MKLLKRLFLLVVISAAVYAGYLLKQQGTGFVLIQYQEFSIETSVFVFSLFLITLFIICYFVLRSVFNLIRIPEFIRRSYGQYQNKKSHSGLIDGLTEFTQGHFKKAENILVKQASNNHSSVLNYLLAARAAQLLNADERRDSYLKQAHEIDPAADVAIALTQAELQLSRQQNEQALATLNQLLSVNPKHEYAMRLMSRAYSQLEDWARLCPLLAELRRSKVLSEDDLQKSEEFAYRGYLALIGSQNDAVKLAEVWQDMPKYLRKNTGMIRLYAEQLINNQLFKEAEVFLRERLNKQWSAELISLYSCFIDKVPDENSEHYLHQLMENTEKWLKNNPHHGVLLLTAGKIAVKLKLWGKAKSFFEASLATDPLADTYLQMALLLEATHEPEKAHDFFKKGLAFSLK